MQRSPERQFRLSANNSTEIVIQSVAQYFEWIKVDELRNSRDANIMVILDWVPRARQLIRMGNGTPMIEVAKLDTEKNERVIVINGIAYILRTSN